MFTRKDIERLASALRQAREFALKIDADEKGRHRSEFGVSVAVLRVAGALANALQSADKKFDEDRFISDCGWPDDSLLHTDAFRRRSFQRNTAPAQINSQSAE